MNKTEKIKTTVYLSEDAASQVDAILSLTKRLDKREKSIAVSTADKSKHLCSGQQIAYLRSSLNKLLKQTC